MSTRCQIGIYTAKPKDLNKFEALLYKHCDGYPDTDQGIVDLITPFLKDFARCRGLEDSEYLAAQLIYFLISASKEEMAKYGDIYKYLSFGICKDFHGDIEYFYAIYPSKIDVYECRFDAEPETFKLIQSVDIKE